MTRLTSHELGEIQKFIDKKIADAESLGLTLEVDDDLWEWRKLMDNAPATGGASKTLDPLVNDIRPGNSFWVKVIDDSGAVIGCQANRFVETEDFVEEYVTTHRFFGNRCPSLVQYPVALQESVPVLRGKLNFGGGGWVHPDWRGKAISGLMSRIGRTLALRHFLIDYYLGFITATANHRLYGRNRQGLMNRRHLLTGHYPGRDEPLEVDIYWMHRGEILNQIAREISGEPGLSEDLSIRTA